jgi:2-amino-4-hydroxy-6-hydroxymethyldihydropteridine diphosphokinase
MGEHETWTPAYVGLGSNLGEPVRQINEALSELARLPRTRLVVASHLYENPPFGELAQPDFVNAVAGLLTRLAPLELFHELRRIEQAHGRNRAAGARWQARTLDLDLLAFGDATIHLPELTIPHPGIAGRNFVLWPLSEIAPGLSIPGLGNAGELAAALGSAGLKKIN